jgi:hypothetical protein
MPEMEEPPKTWFCLSNFEDPVFGGHWVAGMGGLLAALVLLMVAGQASWLATGLLLAADVVVRITLVGLPAYGAAWSPALWAVVAFVDDGLFFFGIVRLAQDNVSRTIQLVADLRRQLEGQARGIQARLGDIDRQRTQPLTSGS